MAAKLQQRAKGKKRRRAVPAPHAPWSAAELAKASDTTTSHIYDLMNEGLLSNTNLGKLKRIPNHEACRLLGITPEQAIELRRALAEAAI